MISNALKSNLHNALKLWIKPFPVSHISIVKRLSNRWKSVTDNNILHWRAISGQWRWWDPQLLVTDKASLLCTCCNLHTTEHSTLSIFSGKTKMFYCEMFLSYWAVWIKTVIVFIISYITESNYLFIFLLAKDNLLIKSVILKTTFEIVISKFRQF